MRGAHRYAETNKIVLLMPRLERGEHGADAVDVNRGCWDVFAQLGEEVFDSN